MGITALVVYGVMLLVRKKKMIDNEKAAIAAGLWEPNRQDYRHHQPTHDGWGDSSGKYGCYVCPVTPAPDMHDPANLWRALENLNRDGWLWFVVNHEDQSIQMKIWRAGTIPASRNHARPLPVADVMFAALVALYDAEHKTQE